MHERFPDTPRTLFKSDVAEAYRLLPVHPYWQIKQVNYIGDSLHVDRNNAFGGRSSGCNWIAFMSLVSWIAKKKRNIELLGTYADDSFGPDLADNLAFYPLIANSCLPTKSNSSNYGMKLIYPTKTANRSLAPHSPL